MTAATTLSLKGRLTAALDAARARRPLLDHVVRTQRHYSAINGNLQAGAVTYFGFLSFFPILALAFFAVGYASRLYPDARDSLGAAIDQLFPGLLGAGDGQISLADVESLAGGVGALGLVAALYTGLGWLSALRTSLLAVFEMSDQKQPAWFLGKYRDLLTLVVLGVTLALSVTLSGLLAGFSSDVLDALDLDTGLSPVLRVVSLLAGLAAGTVLFFAMFTLLARPATPRRALWNGAFGGALAFEVLKLLSAFLLAQTAGQPAFQAFGIALILLVWINYFSRVVLYAAAWAHTSAVARARRQPGPDVSAPVEA